MARPSGESIFMFSIFMFSVYEQVKDDKFYSVSQEKLCFERRKYFDRVYKIGSTIMYNGIKFPIYSKKKKGLFQKPTRIASVPKYAKDAIKKEMLRCP